MKITKNDIQDCVDYIKFAMHKSSPLSQEKTEAIFTIMTKAKNDVDYVLKRKKRHNERH